MTQPWFAPKTHGYGAVPITWQGWLVTLAGAAIIAGAIISALLTHNHRRQIADAAIALIAFAILFTTARATSDGAWRWRK